MRIILTLIASLLDLTIDGVLKVAGVYYWLWEHDLMRGAIYFGISGVWCIACFAGRSLTKSEGK